MGGKFPGWAGWLLGGLAAVLAVVVGWFLLMPPEPEPAPPAQVVTVPAEPVPAEAPEAAQPVPPAFDVVRIKPDGSTVVAGRAGSGVPVRVLVDGAEVFSADGDGGGNFVALFSLPPAGVDRVMTLEAELADGSRLGSEQSVIIEAVELAVTVAEAPEAPEAAPAASAATPDTEPAAPPEGAAGTGADTAPATQPEPAPEPAAPRVLLAGPEGMIVLQDRAPQAQILSVDTISYDAAGEVALTGRGQGEGALRIYLDNAPVGTAQIGADGQWHAPLPEVETGVYTLRVDALGPDGAVTGRVETPFKREESEVLAAAAEEAAAAVSEGRTVSAVIVQPGNTLWAIARHRYGEGILYVRVFEANRDLIRDPDLIYPGQVFSLPNADAGAGGQ